MASLRCRLFLLALEHRHLFKFKFKKETALDWEQNLDEVRAGASKSSKMMGRVPKGLTVSPVSIEDRQAEWIEPQGATRDKVILYFRGGGYVLGSIQMHRAIVGKFVKRTGMAALLFEYRNAPEHPFPSALDDAIAAYGWLLGQGVKPRHIVFAGDSAGGGLLLATLLRLKDEGKPLPGGAAALSPWIDLACTGESYERNARHCLAPANSWYACRKHYAGENDPKLPYISPLYGDLSDLPPLYISAGGHETLLSDSIRFAEKAHEDGVDATLSIGEGLFHCYPACAPIFPEATQALTAICDFLKRQAG